MKINTGFCILFLAIIITLVVSGCVSPPKEKLVEHTTVTVAPDSTEISYFGTKPTHRLTSSAAVSDTGTTTALNASPNTIPVYVTEVTPFATISSTSTTQPSVYSEMTVPTRRPEERSCRIYTKTQSYMYNGTAFTFNLKNPPMYINYSVTPQNITVEKSVEVHRLSQHGEEKIKYEIYDPLSYFVVTVRNKTSGSIYLEDGFGKDYSTYLTRNLKVLRSDDMLIEIKGNKIKATVNFWVKPVGNFDNPDNMTFEACTFWEVSSRDQLAYAPEVTTQITYNPAPTATRHVETPQTIIQSW